VEWIEVTAKTVEEAKEEALDQLGVDESDAEFEVVETEKGGLFGRLRSEARVRARVLPTTPPPKLDRRERRRSGSREGGGDASRSRPSPASRKPATASPRREAPPRREMERPVIDEETATQRDDVAAEFLSGLFDSFGMAHTIDRRRLEDDTSEIAVQGDGLGLLIGPKGQTLSAVQELTRTVVQRTLAAPHGRIVVDVAGYRQARRGALERFTQTVAEEVRSNGVARVLEPMPPADRKVIHDTVNTIDGVVTLSEGEEPQRRVVIAPEEPA
jgi:spoIIIJ-associated protein